MDTNGHGTQVAGIISADGIIKGVAPKSQILAYKVSEDGEGVSPSLIVRAIDMAIIDGADIINISLGVNSTDSQIEKAVDRATQAGVLVIAAAGNDGPATGTIGSPGMNQGALTVGATYNNLTSNIVATLTVNNKETYVVIPMVGTTAPTGTIHSKIILAGHAKESDFENINAEGAIIIAERGSNIDDEMLYFSIKESNAAAANAVALIIYNNEPGLFLGELIHEFIQDGYEPSIPTVSISREEGLDIIQTIQRDDTQDTNATLNFLHNPDVVVPFSSRGPVSPFYIKPDIMAPGAYINTTDINGKYQIASGTSYAAPHVSGAAALLLQKNANLNQSSIKSILMTTTAPIIDYSADSKDYAGLTQDAAIGRLDIAKAYNAELLITPPEIILIAKNGIAQTELHLAKITNGDITNSVIKNNDNVEGAAINVSFEGSDLIKFEYDIHQNNTIKIQMMINTALATTYGEYWGRIHIHDNNTPYAVPFLLYHTEAQINTTLQKNKLWFDIDHKDTWNFAKILITNSETKETATITNTHNNQNASVKIHKNSTYWVEAKITTGSTVTSAYDTIRTGYTTDNSQHTSMYNENVSSFDMTDTSAQRHLWIIAGFAITIGLFMISCNKLQLLYRNNRAGRYNL